MLMNVLFADDAPYLAHLFCHVLERAGYRVVCATDGCEALRLALTGNFMIGVLDIDMPGVTGWEIAKELRAQPSTAHMQLIAISGRSLPEDQKRSEEAGFDQHLNKPISSLQLLDAIQQSADVPWRARMHG
jgi:two-component system, sensor histidine kinase